MVCLLTDQEPPSGPEESESAGGLGAFLNTTPRIIAGITALIGAVSGLLIAPQQGGRHRVRPRRKRICGASDD
jgi:hypothetical protein